MYDKIFSEPDLEKQKKLLSEYIPEKPLSTDLHIKLAELAEGFELFDKAVMHYNLALANATEKAPIYEKLLNFYINENNLSKAIKTIHELIKLNNKNPEYYKILIDLLMPLDKPEEIKKIADIAYEKTKNSYFKNIFEEVEEYKVEELTFDDLTTTLMLSLFSGREGVYSRMWKRPDGETGYMPVREPLSPKVIKNHLMGNITLGIYQLRLDNTVNWLAFDVDIAKFALKYALTDDRKWETFDNAAHALSKEIIEELAKFNIAGYIENSGFKGRHVWVFFEKPVVAKIAKKFGEVITTNLKKKIPEVVIEVFPKQNYIRPDNLGNLIKLPFGVHLKVGKRSYFYDNHDKKAESINNFLKSIKRTDEAHLIEYLNFYKIPDIYGINLPEAKVSKKIEFPAYVDSYSLELDKEFQYIIYKCPVLSELYKKAIKTNELTYEEMIVLIHSIGYLENGVAAVNTIFSKCYNVQPDKYLRSKLKGNSISCAKIAMRIPHITSKFCLNCQFDSKEGLYPSPILHLKKKNIDGINVDILSLTDIIKDYLKLKEKIFEIQGTMKEYEKKFIELLEESENNIINTPVGKLLKYKDEKGNITFKIEI